MSDVQSLFYGDDWLVVPHIIGNFTAVKVEQLTDPPRMATLDDPVFYLLEEALEYAQSQPNVLWVPYSRWGARWHRFKKQVVNWRESRFPLACV
jgi:hypothetical protein